MQENAVLGTTHKKPKEKHDTQEQAKTDISIQYNRNSHSWRENPNHTSHPITDENVGLQGEHRIQALTKLDHSDDVDISAGPELIIKDDKHNASFKTGDQPDSELGIGMHFKYDF
ncbi:MAG: hypothetical protein J5803_00845 [Desulfovibrio sp.]|nr:hypothetical protein [Desulfovibrio sp.]